MPLPRGPRPWIETDPPGWTPSSHATYFRDADHAVRAGELRSLPPRDIIEALARLEQRLAEVEDQTR